MNFNDFFKGFFYGESTHDEFQDFFQERQQNEADFERDASGFFNERDRPFGYESGFSEVLEMFKHVEKIFHDFNTADFSTNIIVPQFPQIMEKEVTPRQNMLKDPEFESKPHFKTDGENFSIEEQFKSKSTPKMDIDLDDKVCKDGLAKIYEEDSMKADIYKPHRSYYNFTSSVGTITNHNGKIEEHKTMKDSKGIVTTTTRQSLGDQSYTVTTKSDSHGEIERKEEFVNLDETTLDDFKKKWKQPRQFNPSIEGSQETRNTMLKENDSLLSKLSKLFTWNQPNN